MSAPRILVAGIGNIFLGDDGFGVEVVQRLAGRDRSEDVRVVDFGIRGFDLTCALLDGPQQVILVDAVCRGGRPGTLYLIEPAPAEGKAGTPAEAGAPLMDGHDLVPGRVLALVAAMGGRRPPSGLYLVGCEPQAIPSLEDDVQVGLSPPVSEAVEAAAALIEELLAGGDMADAVALAEAINRRDAEVTHA